MATPTRAAAIMPASVRQSVEAANRWFGEGSTAGKGIRVPAGGLRDYLRERGRSATERADAKSA